MTRKLAQVPITTSDQDFVSLDRSTDAFQVIEALGRVQCTFRAARLVCHYSDPRAKLAILLTNQVQCK